MPQDMREQPKQTSANPVNRRKWWCGHGVTIRTRLRSRSKDSKSTSNQVRLGTPAIIFGLSALLCSTLADSSSTIRGLGLDRAEIHTDVVAWDLLFCSAPQVS